jgi:hypothetical protein
MSDSLNFQPTRVAVAEMERAIGHAMARWQMVETALYVLAHCLMGTTREVSSIAFFHIKSAESKFGFVDKLCLNGLPKSVYQRKWTVLRKESDDLIRGRNALAHFEMSWVETGEAKSKSKFPIALHTHHLNTHATRHGKAQGMYVETVLEGAEAFEVYAKQLIQFAAAEIPDWPQRVALLPPNLRRFLESIRNMTNREGGQPQL